MKFEFVCPECQDTLRLEPELIGKQIRCPLCRAKVQVVAPTAENRPVAEQPDVALPFPEEKINRSVDEISQSTTKMSRSIPRSLPVSEPVLPVAPPVVQWQPGMAPPFASPSASTPALVDHPNSGLSTGTFSSTWPEEPAPTPPRPFKWLPIIVGVLFLAGLGGLYAYIRQELVAAPKRLLAEAETFYKRADWKDARKAYQEFAEKYPTAKEAGDARNYVQLAEVRAQIDTAQDNPDWTRKFAAIDTFLKEFDGSQKAEWLNQSERLEPLLADLDRLHGAYALWFAKEGEKSTPQQIQSFERSLSFVERVSKNPKVTAANLNWENRKKEKEERTASLTRYQLWQKEVNSNSTPDLVQAREKFYELGLNQVADGFSVWTNAQNQWKTRLRWEDSSTTSITSWSWPKSADELPRWLLFPWEKTEKKLKPGLCHLYLNGYWLTLQLANGQFVSAQPLPPNWSHHQEDGVNMFIESTAEGLSLRFLNATAPGNVQPTVRWQLPGELVAVPMVTLHHVWVLTRLTDNDYILHVLDRQKWNQAWQWKFPAGAVTPMRKGANAEVSLMHDWLGEFVFLASEPAAPKLLNLTNRDSVSQRLATGFQWTTGNKETLFSIPAPFVDAEYVHGLDGRHWWQEERGPDGGDIQRYAFTGEKPWNWSQARILRVHAESMLVWQPGKIIRCVKGFDRLAGPIARVAEVIPLPGDWQAQLPARADATLLLLRQGEQYQLVALDDKGQVTWRRYWELDGLALFQKANRWFAVGSNGMIQAWDNEKTDKEVTSQFADAIPNISLGPWLHEEKYLCAIIQQGEETFFQLRTLLEDRWENVTVRLPGAVAAAPQRLMGDWLIALQDGRSVRLNSVNGYTVTPGPNWKINRNLEANLDLWKCDGSCLFAVVGNQLRIWKWTGELLQNVGEPRTFPRNVLDVRLSAVGKVLVLLSDELHEFSLENREEWQKYAFPGGDAQQLRLCGANKKVFVQTGSGLYAWQPEAIEKPMLPVLTLADGDTWLNRSVDDAPMLTGNGRVLLWIAEAWQKGTIPGKEKRAVFSIDRQRDVSGALRLPVWRPAGVDLVPVDVTPSR